MCITIKQGVPESRQSNPIRNQGGFTLPEVLVSLCILLLLMSVVWQWGPLIFGTASRMEDNECAVYLAQQALEGILMECPDGWTVSVEQSIRSELLQETIVTVHTGQRSWEFYYAGQR